MTIFLLYCQEPYVEHNQKFVVELFGKNSLQLSC